VLPPLRDSFVGRASDLERIHQRLAEARLVTLVGAPGIGKTRVAIELARAHESEFSHVVFVPLGAAGFLGPALAALGAALELDLPPLPEAELPAAVAAALSRFGPTLLILDNFEQLVESASVLVEHILSGAPETQVLITSRRKLRIAREWVYELGALPCADREGSVALLIDRVRKMRGDYTPSASEIAQLQAIAAKLEGIPLALELAAVRISTLGAASVLAHLDRPLSVLTGGSRSSSAEHSSLRDAIARSWVLLSESERAVLAACSVFRGGFDLPAATAIVPCPEGATLLDALHDLCEKSLLNAQPKDDGTQRFQLFESMREFGAAQLDTDTKAELERRHAKYFAELGERLSPELAGRDVGDALDALAAERDNILAAAGRGLEGRASVGPELGLRAALSIVPLALARGPIAPLVERLDRALLELTGLSERLKITAHLATARGARRSNRTEDARRHQAAALALAAQHDDPRILAQIESDLAMTLISEGALSSAIDLLRSALRGHERAGDRGGEAIDRLRMGIALRELGRGDEAEAMLVRAEDLLSASGNAAFRGLALAELAHLALDRSDFAAARSLLEEASSPRIRNASILTDAAITARTGMLAHAEGDLDRAETLLQAAVIGLRRVGYRRFEAGVTGYLGSIDLERERHESARSRLKECREMLRGDARAEDFFSAWLVALEVMRNDLTAARRVSARVRPLDRTDPLSVAAHVLLRTLDRSELTNASDLLSELGTNARSHDVSLALRVLFRGDEAERSAESAIPPLKVAASGRWFVTPDGERGECQNHRALRLLLLDLVEQRLRQPGRAVSREQLVAAGWPGEVIKPEAARNRLKVSISSLRKLGLRDLVLHDGEGYLIDPSVPVVVASE
jgi:predicted ATPase/tetratricopeptide (TPR) repeat protein